MLDKLFGLKSEQPKESAPDQGHVVEPVEVGETKPSKPERVAHLKEGVPAIMACVGTYSDFESEMSREAHDFDIQALLLGLPIEKGQGDVGVVDWYEDASMLNEKNVRNAGSRTYAISDISENPKFSKQYYDCTAVVVTGTDAKTGKNISFMSHQEPDAILRNHKDEFVADIAEQAKALISRCEPRTVDAVFAGGSFYKSAWRFDKDYPPIVDLVSEAVGSVLGFRPYVVVGPKTASGKNGDAIFYDTDHRRLYLIRPENTKGSPANAGYHPRDIEEEAKKWDN